MNFKIGDKVRKVTGYPFEGTVVATYADEEKSVVKHNDGWEHIFSNKQLYPYTPEFQYLDLLKDVMENGDYRDGRNGGTFSLFGRQIRFDLSEGFPLLTTKKLHIKSIVGELLWMLSGSTNVKPLQEQGITIWDEWADDFGDLGPIYGCQWRSWWEHYDDVAIDQIQNVINGLKNDPYGRRHIVSAWNTSDIHRMALPPCHCLFQFYVRNGKLDCQLYQRSADIFLGVPFNIASYALLIHLIAKEVGLEVGEFIHTFGDLHLYANHITQAIEQVKRLPTKLPNISIAEKPIFDLVTSDITINNYEPQAHISAPVSK